MRRILCIIVACIMATVFMSATDVSALSLAKILNTEWETKVVSKWYDPSGNYYAYGGGQGLLEILVDEVTMLSADFIDTKFENTYVFIGVNLDNYTYNATKNKLKSTECVIAYLDRDLLPISSYIYPSCTAKIIFTTNNRFKGTVTFTDGFGDKNVITITGKKVGKRSGIITATKSLIDKLKKNEE